MTSKKSVSANGVSILTSPHPFTYYPDDPNTPTDILPKDKPHINYQDSGSARLVYPEMEPIVLDSSNTTGRKISFSFHTSPIDQQVKSEDKNCDMVVVGAPYGMYLQDHPDVEPQFKLVVGPDTDFKNGVRNETSAICGTKAFKIYRPTSNTEETNRLLEIFIKRMEI